MAYYPAISRTTYNAHTRSSTSRLKISRKEYAAR
jgi:hypothetical protein